MRAAALALLAVACGPALPPPLPRVIATSPSGAVAPDAVAVEVEFSAPVGRTGLEDGRWFALCRREDLRDVLRAIESDLGVTPGPPVVAARIDLADGGKRVVLRPSAPLDPDRPWAAVLSYRVRSADGRAIVDAEGKARSVAVLFETGAALDRQPPRPRWVTPPHGPLPANVRLLRVGFDEPVTGLLATSGPSAGRSAPASAEMLDLTLDGPLPAGPLTLDLRGVQDAAGNESAPLEPILVSRCSAEAPPPIAPELQVTPGRLAIDVRASLRGMGRLVAELRARPGDPPCGAVPAGPAALVVTGEVLACPGWDPCAPEATTCATELAIEHLCPGQELQLRVATEDLAGHRSAYGAVRSAASLPPAPAAAVTEILADADPPESGGEYVEVANLGTGDLDLVGYSLAKRTATGKLVRCAIAESGPTLVPPGGHALVVGGAYDGRYALPEGTVVVRCGVTALDGGLSNEQPVALALLDRTGSPVSTAGLVEPVERCGAGALERIHPAGPDSASNWTCPGTRSPGACNAGTPADECPRRAW